MKPISSILFLLLVFGSCNKPEIGAPDNETISRKLFDTMRDNSPDKILSLLPDKGTYKKIMREWKNIDIPESAYDSLIMNTEKNFIVTRKMLDDWSGSKYANTHTEMMKEGILQIAKATTKFEIGQEHYKYTFTSCKFNGRWFILGDIAWIPKDQI